MTIDVEVELEDAQLRRLLFSNRWKDRGDAEQLADSISAAIRAALPEARESTAPGAGLRSAAYALTTLQLREYMARHREHTRRAADFSRRVAAGEFLGEPAPEAAEDGRNVDIRFKDGRFDRVLINPEWAEKTTAAAIVDAVLAAFDGVALVSESPAAEELAALAGERARLQEFVGGAK